MSGKRAKAIRKALKFNPQAHRDSVAFASDLHQNGRTAEAQQIGRAIAINRHVYQRAKKAVKSAPDEMRGAVVNAYAAALRAPVEDVQVSTAPPTPPPSPQLEDVKP